MKRFLSPPLRWLLQWVPPRLIRIAPARVVSAYLVAVTVHPKNFEVSTKWGFLITGNTRDVIQRHIYMFRQWEPTVSKWFESSLRLGDVVVDVGANVGYNTLLASILVGEDGEVVAFEPVESFCNRIEHHLFLNRVTNVSLHRLILSDHWGKMEMFMADPDNLGNSSIIPGDSRKSVGMVDCRPLDDVLSESQAAAIRILKIDTEGSEVDVLRGARRTLSLLPRGASVIVEITPELLLLRGYETRDVWEHFPASEWQAWDLRNEYDVTAYRGRPSTPVIRSTSGDERLDVAFVKR